MWLDRPPPPKKKELIKLLRPKPGEQICGHLCGEPLRLFLHFTSNRSWPCVGEECCLCKRQVPRRYYAYYPVHNEKGMLGIIELTSQAEDQLHQQMKEITDVAAGYICIGRDHGRRNNPLIVNWKESEEYKHRGSNQLKPAALQACLMRIWNLPSMNGTLTDREYLTSLNETIKQRTQNP